MIAATKSNVEWLLERLYVARRTLQASNVDYPVFVLLTRNMEDRRKVEDMFYRYFSARYALEWTNHICSDFETADITRIELPEINASVVLMDIGNEQILPRPV